MLKRLVAGCMAGIIGLTMFGCSPSPSLSREVTELNVSWKSDPSWSEEVDVSEQFGYGDVYYKAEDFSLRVWLYEDASDKGAMDVLDDEMNFWSYKAGGSNWAQKEIETKVINGAECSIWETYVELPEEELAEGEDAEFYQKYAFFKKGDTFVYVVGNTKESYPSFDAMIETIDIR